MNINVKLLFSPFQKTIQCNLTYLELTSPIKCKRQISSTKLNHKFEYDRRKYIKLVEKY